MDKDRFRQAANDIMNHQKAAMGIGTLSERSVHAVLKRYYGSEAASELPLAGFVADILTDRGAIEIQTHNLRLIRRKLEVFLPLMPVTLVHPIAIRHRTIRVDIETGEIEKPRTLPRKGSVYEAFVELASIRDLLVHPNLRIVLPLIIVDDIRLKRPLMKGSKLVDRMPSDLIDEIEIDSPKDFLRFVPENLPDPFTSEDFAIAVKIHRSLAQSFLLTADHLGLLSRIGKTRNAWLYQIK